MSKTILSNNLRMFLLILFLSPGILWIFLNFKSYIKEWAMTPSYVRSNVSSLFSPKRLEPINEVRWNAFGPEREDFSSKLVYNKAYLALDHFFSYLSFLSPRIYFQAGDNTRFSPQSVEPIAFFMFFFWLMGILFLLKDKKTKILVAPLIFAALAFLVGRRTMPFLLPILISYLYCSYLGMLATIKKKRRNVFWTIFLVYSIFLIGRMFYLK
jgi:hypothetical protein